MGHLYGRAGRLNTQNGGFRHGQCAQAQLGCGWRGARRCLAAHAAGCWHERGRGHLEQMEAQLRAQEALNRELAEKAALAARTARFERNSADSAAGAGGRKGAGAGGAGAGNGGSPGGRSPGGAPRGQRGPLLCNSAV